MIGWPGARVDGNLNRVTVYRYLHRLSGTKTFEDSRRVPTGRTDLVRDRNVAARSMCCQGDEASSFLLLLFVIVIEGEKDENDDEGADNGAYGGRVEAERCEVVRVLEIASNTGVLLNDGCTTGAAHRSTLSDAKSYGALMFAASGIVNEVFERDEFYNVVAFGWVVVDVLHEVKMGNGNGESQQVSLVEMP